LAGPFDYPDTPAGVRHGPRGYAEAGSFRPWLRDEYSFRCVFCLIREQWGRITGEFDVEHFQPLVRNPKLGTVYENLLYACHACNLLKGQRNISDPRRILVSGQVTVNSDGTIVGLTDDAKRLIDVLCLNSDDYRRWRLIWIRNVELAMQYDREQYVRLMGFPQDLPDLSILRPPGGNARPEGISEGCFARRERGELTETY
jgi:hypothetical protein